MKINFKLVWLMPAVCLTTVLTGCPDPKKSADATPPAAQEGTPTPGAPGRPISLDQGWSNEQRQKFWFTSQGSELVPYDWFLALEQAESTELIRSNENLGNKLGFLLETPSPANPDGLPAGFAKTKDEKGVVWLGMSCAACHANQIDTGKASLRIDGGPTLADTTSFFDQVAYGLQATGEDEAKFDRFARRVLRQGYNPESAKALRGDIKDASTVRGLAALRVERQTQDKPSHPYGYARTDAFGQVFNEVLVMDLTQLAEDLQWSETDINLIASRNTMPADVPVSYPFLWDTPYYDLVQWPGTLPNTGPMGLARDAGELLGVFGNVTLTRDLGIDGFQSSAQIESMGEIQTLLKQLMSPLWPDDYLPPLDPTKVGNGQEIYRQQCAECHTLINRSDPNRHLYAVMTPLSVPGNGPDLGTDPTAVDRALNRLAWTGPLKGAYLFGSFGQKFGEWVNANQMLKHVTVGVLAAHKFADIEAVRKEYTAAELPPTFAPRSYKARSLNGIWATAPYLHNGSVPNLWELLKPPAQRVKKFHVGSRRYDPVNVGFDTTTGSPLETGLPGNSNAGHPYGTHLSDDQKWALIEYIKSL